MLSLGFKLSNLFDILDDLSVPEVLLHALAEPIQLSLPFRVEHLVCLSVLPVVLLQNLPQLLRIYVVFQHQLPQLFLTDRSLHALASLGDL